MHRPKTIYLFPKAPERTRAVASFFRNASVSSSDSVMVVVALALDTPRLGPLLTAWERGPLEPEAAPDEVGHGAGRRLLRTRLGKREIQKRGDFTKSREKALALMDRHEGFFKGNVLSPTFTLPKSRFRTQRTQTEQ